MDLFETLSILKQNRLEKSIWVAKLVLMSMGIISILNLLKVSIIPYTFDLVLSTLPQLWFSLRKWFTVPFLYIIVNFIIITIIASSNFTNQTNNTNPIELENPTNVHHEEEKVVEQVIEEVEVVEEEKVVEQVTEEVEVVEEEKEKRVVKVENFGLLCNKFNTNPSMEKCRNDYYLQESEGGDDSLEATWKAIMEGEGKSKKPHLKKSDTWAARIVKAEPFGNNGDDDNDDDPVSWAKKELEKSETFNDRASLRREKSMSLEELNKRSEDFIKKFHNQLKLQRLESYQRNRKLVNGGV